MTKPRLTDPQRVRRERVKAGLRQMELARRARLSKAQMHQIETGKRDASVDSLHRIAKALNCDVECLMPDPVQDVSREPKTPPPASRDVRELRDEERAVAQQVPELPQAAVDRRRAS